MSRPATPYRIKVRSWDWKPWATPSLAPTLYSAQARTAATPQAIPLTGSLEASTLLFTSTSSYPEPLWQPVT